MKDGGGERPRAKEGVAKPPSAARGATAKPAPGRAKPAPPPGPPPVAMPPPPGPHPPPPVAMPPPSVAMPVNPGPVPKPGPTVPKPGPVANPGPVPVPVPVPKWTNRHQPKAMTTGGSLRSHGNSQARRSVRRQAAMLQTYAQELSDWHRQAGPGVQAASSASTAAPSSSSTSKAAPEAVASSATLLQ